MFPVHCTVKYSVHCSLQCRIQGTVNYVVHGKKGREVGVPESIGQPVGHLCSVKYTVLCKALSILYSVQSTMYSFKYVLQYSMH